MDGKQLLACIKKAASKVGNAYDEGLYQIRVGRVMDVSDRLDAEGNVVISGDVRSDSYLGAALHPSVTLDLKSPKVISHTCTCAEHKSNGGICKHGVATVLTYLRFAEYSDMPQVSSGYSKPTIGTTQTLPRDTSPAVFQLISTYSERTVATAIDAAENQAQGQVAGPVANPVELIVFLSAPHGTGFERRCDLHFKIGHKWDQFYVVKNITNLLEARSKGTLVKYGKRLEFTHRRSAFSRTANTVLDLVDHWIAEARAAFDAQQRRTYRSYYYSAPEYSGPKRSMELTCSQACELLDTLQGTTVTFESSRYVPDVGATVSSVEELSVCEGTPQLSMTIATGVRDSYDLGIAPPYLYCLMGDSSSYLLGQRRALRCPDEFTKDVGAAPLWPCSRCVGPSPSASGT